MLYSLKWAKECHTFVSGDLYLPAAEVAQLLDEHQDEIKKEV